jgi:hypothetical protein
MATQIKKFVMGPLTSDKDAAPGVVFKAGEETIVALALADLSQDVVTRLAVHGLAQKIGDSYAGAGEESDPLAAAKAWIAETVDQLKKGDWRVAAVGGGPRASLLAKALARATGQTLEDSIAVIDLLPDEDVGEQPGKKSLRKALKAIMDEISAEEAAARAAKSKGRAADVGGLSALFGAGLKG